MKAVRITYAEFKSLENIYRHISGKKYDAENKTISFSATDGEYMAASIKAMIPAEFVEGFTAEDGYLHPADDAALFIADQYQAGNLERGIEDWLDAILDKLDK